MKASGILKSLKFGDVIEIIFKQKKINAEFIRFDTENKLAVLKLKSGYDIVVSPKEISSVKVLKKAAVHKEKKEKQRGLPKSNPDLSIITTGGTISSKIDYKTGGVSPSVPPEYYFQIAPELKKFGAVEVNPLMSILSENMKPSDWVKMAKSAYDSVRRGAKGVIITTGTDTMHYAASALSFLLNPLSVPIVFTGAQRSPDRGSTDASTNLLLSAETATNWAGGESVICMHATINDDYNFILRGNKTRKMHSERRDAFRPINSDPLGKVFHGGHIEKISDFRVRSEKTVLDTKIDDKVMMIISYPGMDGRVIEDAISEGSHGLVIIGTGFGNLPFGDASVRRALSKADRENIPVAITSQTIYGPTNRFVYSTLRELSSRKNILYLGNMTSETAFVKLMFTLGHTKKIEEIRKMMETPLAGEISERDKVGDFLV